MLIILLIIILFNVRIDKLLSFIVAPPVVRSDHLKLGSPHQEVIPGQIGEILNLRIVRSGGLSVMRGVSFSATLVQ